MDVDGSAAASSVWLAEVHCGGSISKKEGALQELLQLKYPAPPQALLVALLQGTADAGAGQEGEAARQVLGDHAGVVEWLRHVTAAADWCCWALEQG